MPVCPAKTKRSALKPALLSGKPRSPKPLEIVRPVFPPLTAFSGDFQAALNTGQVTNNGPFVRKLEEALTRYHDAPTIVFSSGQAALMTMMAAADVAGGEVIVPSYTFAATPHAVVWAGAKPVFADIDPVSMTLDPADVEKKITKHTKAIMGMCTYGIACDYDALEALGAKHGIKVLFDSAPAFGTRVNGRPVGDRGDGQIFSFHATKAFTTMEGGSLTSRNAALIEKAKIIRNFGQNNGANCTEVGMNGKMMELPAMIGLLQLDAFDALHKRRMQVAEAYRAGLSDLPGVRLATPPAGQEPVWLYYPVVFDEAEFGLSREHVWRGLGAENINVRKYFELPCHHMSCYAEHNGVSLPVTEAIAYNVIGLPVYGDQTDDEIAAVVESIRALHAHAGEIKQKLAA